MRYAQNLRGIVNALRANLRGIVNALRANLRGIVNALRANLRRRRGPVRKARCASIKPKAHEYLDNNLGAYLFRGDVRRRDSAGSASRPSGLRRAETRGQAVRRDIAPRAARRP